MKRLLLLLLVSFPSHASDLWQLMVVHRDGQVVVNPKMDRHACEFARARVLGLPATDAEKKAVADQNAKEKAGLDLKVKAWCSAHPDDANCPRTTAATGMTLKIYMCGDGNPWCDSGISSTSFGGFSSVNEVTHAECFQ